MKKYLSVLIICLGFFSAGNAGAIDRRSIIDSLTTIDPEIRKYFPRWKVCETDLQIQIYQAFRLAGFDEKSLNMSKIEILSAPHNDSYMPWELLLVNCGNSSMTAAEIETNLNNYLVTMLNGEYSFSKRMPNDPPKRDYCHTDIPPEIPVTATQAAAIANYLEPTNVNHSFSLSLFEQTVKIGESGFWLKNSVGTDEVGYPFWYSGDAKITLRRPLYTNKDNNTTDRIPYLINAYLGGGYRISSGIDNSNTLFSWVPERTLNHLGGGKIIAGMDFNMPFEPVLGIHANLEIPLSQLKRQYIDIEKYGYYYKRVDDGYGNLMTVDSVVPVMRAIGQASVFYNLWIGNPNPEHYFRFDVGLSYCEVRELPFAWDDNRYLEPSQKPWDTNYSYNTYKPNEFGDWIYLKAEYRSQSTWPFGFSVQYSNQILLGRVYIPIVGNWLYLEGKYATPLRGLRPYEIKNYFMISPVLRFTI